MNTKTTQQLLDELAAKAAAEMLYEIDNEIMAALRSQVRDILRIPMHPDAEEFARRSKEYAEILNGTMI